MLPEDRSDRKSPAADPFHLHEGHLATHATASLSSLVHEEGVVDFMSRSAHSFPPLIYRTLGGLRQAPGRGA